MSDTSKLSIIVPAYNEEKTVGKVLQRLLTIPFPGWETEVIVVNDASTDETLAALKIFSPRIKIIDLAKNGGKGSAVHAALEVATGDFAVIQDADLECRPEEIPLLLEALGSSDPYGKTAVIGSRETHENNPKKKTLSRFGSLSITKLINLLYGSSLTDASMCYKLFPKDAFRYFGEGGFEAEILFLLRLLKNGYRIIEVPVSYLPRSTNEGKKIRYRDGVKILLKILWFRFFGK